jgi:uncharacterized protein with ParB-like and HNH nuclease domain
MRASKANLMQLMAKAGHIEVPVYQRSYSWTVKQCSQLWDDLISLANNETIQSHFMGVIVYVEKDLAQISSTNTVYLIDGQQRLTTVSLLLAALGKVLEGTGQKNEITKRKINNKFLFNPEEEGFLKYKLSLNNDDKDSFYSILEGNDDFYDTYSLNIVENYEFFKKTIKDSGISPNKLFNALTRLEIIDVALQKDIDNPQLIFDSLNSTGVNLSQSDQIRNYILMGLDKREQDEIYLNYWMQMEQSFASSNDPSLMERFLADYLTIQNNGYIPPANQVYSVFNKFFNDRIKILSRREIIKRIHRYSKYFLKLVKADIEDDDLRIAVEQINEIGAKDAYPFLMEVFDDFENSLINKDILLEILKTVEGFVSKRITNPVLEQNSTFATLSKDINNMLALKDFMPKIVTPDTSKKSVKIRDLISIGK